MNPEIVAAMVAAQLAKKRQEDQMRAQSAQAQEAELRPDHTPSEAEPESVPEEETKPIIDVEKYKNDDGEVDVEAMQRDLEMDLLIRDLARQEDEPSFTEEAAQIDESIQEDARFMLKEQGPVPVNEAIKLERAYRAQRAYGIENQQQVMQRAEEIFKKKHPDAEFDLELIDLKELEAIEKAGQELWENLPDEDKERKIHADEVAEGSRFGRIEQDAETLFFIRAVEEGAVPVKEIPQRLKEHRGQAAFWLDNEEAITTQAAEQYQEKTGREFMADMWNAAQEDAKREVMMEMWEQLPDEEKQNIIAANARVLETPVEKDYDTIREEKLERLRKVIQNS